LAAALLVGLALSAATVFRTPLLATVGRALVLDETLQRADAIVIAIDAGDAGVLEAADLVRNGFGERVAVFIPLPDRAGRELARRGVPNEDTAARSVRQLRALGVAVAEPIPQAVTGTEEQGLVLPAWCDQQAVRSVIVVTGTDHSRRVGRVLRRAMKGHRTVVRIRPSRYSEFDPDEWWHDRAGLRTGISELQKLLLDFLRHPLS
jgi:hypothetical protein